MDTRTATDILNDAFQKASQADTNESKLKFLEEALCSPGVDLFLAQDQKYRQRFQNEYESCSVALAKELTGLNSYQYSEIDNLDSVEVKKQGYGYKIPLSHRKITSTFNTISHYVARQILLEEHVDKRTVLLERWINIALKCFDNKDFNTCFAIIAGINSNPIYRLKATKEGLSPIAKEFLEIVTPLLSNPEAITAIMSRTGTDIVPYYGTYRTQLTFTSDKLDAATQKKDFEAAKAEKQTKDQILLRLERIRSYLASVGTIKDLSKLTPLQATILRTSLFQIMREIKEEKMQIEEEIKKANEALKEAAIRFTSPKGPIYEFEEAKTEFEKANKIEDKTSKKFLEAKAKYESAEKKYNEEKSKYEKFQNDQREILKDLTRKKDAIIAVYDGAKGHEKALKETLQALAKIPQNIEPPSTPLAIAAKKKESGGASAETINSEISTQIEPRNLTITSSKIFTNVGALIIHEIPSRINDASLITDCTNIMKDSASTTNNMRNNHRRIEEACKTINPSTSSIDPKSLLEMNQKIEEIRLFVFTSKRAIESHLAGGQKMAKDEGNIVSIQEKLQTAYASLSKEWEALNIKDDKKDIKTTEALKLLKENIDHISKLIEVFSKLAEPLGQLNASKPAPTTWTQMRRPITVRFVSSPPLSEGSDELQFAMESENGSSPISRKASDDSQEKTALSLARTRPGAMLGSARGSGTDLRKRALAQSMDTDGKKDTSPSSPLAVHSAPVSTQGSPTVERKADDPRHARLLDTAAVQHELQKMHDETEKQKDLGNKGSSPLAHKKLPDLPKIPTSPPSKPQQLGSQQSLPKATSLKTGSPSQPFHNPSLIEEMRKKQLEKQKLEDQKKKEDEERERQGSSDSLHK